MKKVIFMSLLSVMFLFLSAQKSLACSCMRDTKPLKTQVKKAYQGSAAVFSGEVIEITQKDEWTMLVKIKVAKSWKNKFEREITVSTAKESSLCGYYFEIGKKYLVYADGSKDSLNTNNCSRTSIWSEGQEIKHLDRLKRTKGKYA